VHRSWNTSSQGLNFYEMTDRLGIERGWVALPSCGLTQATAVRRCQKCAHVADCRAWLDASTGERTYPPHWCPNVDLIVELLYDHPAFRASQRPNDRERPAAVRRLLSAR
jgi:hypothetical protein